MATEKKSTDREIAKEIARAAGWMPFKAKREIANARKLGISPKQFLKKRCWNMGSEELEELGEKLKRQKRLLEEQAAELSGLTGWTESESTSRIREARSAGITFKQYINRRAYEIPPEDLPELALVLKANKRFQGAKRSYMLDMIVERSGWTRSYVKESLEKAKEKGINIFNYFANSCWDMDEDQMEACSELCSKFQENLHDKHEKCLDYIIGQTGWTAGETILKTLAAAADSGCSVEDYARCRMWEMTADEQRTFINSSIFRKFRIENNDFQVGSPIFDYKDKFEEVFSDLISRRHFTFEGMTKGDFFDKIKGLKHIVVKPVRGSYGRDIEILPCNQSYLQNGDLYQHLVDIGMPLVIEEKIEQCEQLKDLCPSSVNTLRVVTLLRENDTHVLQCVLRCGVGAVVDNIHSGGLVIEVDPETGVCKGDAVDYYGNLVQRHPVTGVTFKGLQIPNIGDVITLAEEAAKVVPECKLIGWDIAVTPGGADLVEGNLKADYDAAQMAHLGVAREGLRQTMVAPYVHPSDLGRSYLDDLAKNAEDADSIKGARFKFSVVMPVYNAEKYLKEVMRSLISQTIGFEENIQVVLVNDGSPDNSASICKEYERQYPENVVFVDKENGGPSSARNAGIPYAKGAFINFLDPDDKWEKDAFENVWKLISKHMGEIDVVGCRQRFFEAKKGYHQLDYKFKEGDRVIDVSENPDFVQLSATSSFIANSAFKRHTFDDRISLGDDSKLMVEVVLDKGRYGVCRSAVHDFRKRENESSITQTKTENKSTYVGTLKHYYSFIADYSVEKFGRLIPYVQHCLVNGLKYRATQPMPEVLDDKEAEEYRRTVIDLISRLDDGTLLEAHNASPGMKLFMEHLKTGKPMDRLAEIVDGDVWVNGGIAFKITGNGDVILEDVDVADGSLLVEGSVRVPEFVDSFGFFYEVSGSIAEIELSNEMVEEKIGITGEKVYERVPFSFDVALDGSEVEIRLFASYEDHVLCMPLSIGDNDALKLLKKDEIELDGYSISRPDKFAIKVKPL